MLEPGVVVGRHAREQRDFLTAQPAGAASGTARQPDVLGLQRLSAAAQEVGKKLTIHAAHSRCGRLTQPGTPSPNDNHPTIALVTGASRGLGRATALALADAGLDVVITYRSSEADARDVVASIESRGRRGVALHLDTTDIASFGAFVERLRAELPDGTFDVLVNNAGTALYSKLTDTTEAQFDEVFDVHVKGPFFLTQALEPLLADHGRIVNISSGLTRMTFARSGAYASAKGAVEVLTRYQALEYGERGITANVLAVGAVPTDFGDGHLRSDQALQSAMIGLTALRRLATPEDIGQAVAGLTTASGSWITGQRIEASGGARL